MTAVDQMRRKSRDRMRLSRRRRRDGAVVVRLVLSPEGVADLARWGWLPQSAAASDVPAALLDMMERAFVVGVRRP